MLVGRLWDKLPNDMRAGYSAVVWLGYACRYLDAISYSSVDTVTYSMLMPMLLTYPPVAFDIRPQPHDLTTPQHTHSTNYTTLTIRLGFVLHPVGRVGCQLRSLVVRVRSCVCYAAVVTNFVNGGADTT